MKSSLVVVLLLATVSHAQSKPTLVDYPLDVKMPLGATQRRALQDDFRLILAKRPGVLVATRSAWSAALAAHRRQDCDVRNECLQQLTVAAATLYGLYAVIEQNAAGTEVRASGRVVNRDGAVVRPPVLITVPKKTTMIDAAKAALEELASSLELSSLPPVLAAPVTDAPPAPLVVAAAETPPLEVAPFPAKTDAPIAAPAPTEPVVAATPESNVVTAAPPPVKGARVAAWVTTGLAVAAAGVAVGFGVTALTQRATLPADGRFTDSAQVATQLQVNQLATVSLASGVGAGALAVVAGVLFAGSGAPSVAVAPTVGGATLVWSGPLDP